MLAVYALITKHTDSELLLGLIIVTKMASLGLFSPMAGYLTDRFDRRTLMILCDAGRGLVVLGFIWIDSYSMLWLAYVLMAAQMMMSSVFEPAKTSSIPNVTKPEQLVNANILSSLSWSIIFTTGMAIGGLATAWIGIDTVFLLNTLSYFASGWFIWRVVIPQVKAGKESGIGRNPLHGIVNGFRFLRENTHVLRPALAKGAFTMFLGSLVYMMVLVSENILEMGSIGLGLIYASRGAGTAVGPFVGRRLFRSEDTWIQAMGLFMILGGICYLVVGFSSSLLVIMLFVFLAHMNSGANWVMSTVLLQRRAPDVYRGRSFSVEWLFFTMAQSGSILIASNLLDQNWLTLNEAILLFAGLLILTGVIWSSTVTVKEKRYVRGLHFRTSEV